MIVACPPPAFVLMLLLISHTIITAFACIRTLYPLSLMAED